ncbi:MAG: hypothetical protein SFV15_20610 [Polyangiaceae bacterium]|nr:hypothetical protein [Polyangiaceae bacterium]
MKQSSPIIALSLIATWTFTAQGEPGPAKVAPIQPAIPNAAPAPLKLSGALKTKSSLTGPAKLSLAKELAGRLKLAMPSGLEAPLQLSARHPYEEGRADLSVTCATRFDPVANIISPAIYKNTPSFNLPVPQLPKPPCEQAHNQALKLRVRPSKAGQAIMFDILVELEPSPIPALPSSAEIEVFNPLQPGARQTWRLSEGDAGHLTGIMMPPGLEWASLEVRVLSGGVSVRSVEFSPLR